MYVFVKILTGNKMKENEEEKIDKIVHYVILIFLCLKVVPRYLWNFVIFDKHKGIP